MSFHVHGIYVMKSLNGVCVELNLDMIMRIEFLGSFKFEFLLSRKHQWIPRISIVHTYVLLPYIIHVINNKFYKKYWIIPENMFHNLSLNISKFQQLDKYTSSHSFFESIMAIWLCNGKEIILFFQLTFLRINQCWTFVLNTRYT